MSATVKLLIPLLALLLHSPLLLAQDEEAAPEESKPAEVEVAPDASMRDILESEEQVDKLVQEKSESSPKGELRGITPLEAMLALREEMRAERIDRSSVSNTNIRLSLTGALQGS